MDTLVEEMVIETCCHEGCGVTFAITSGLYDLRKRDGKSFFCPNGHGQFFTNNDAKKFEDMKAARARAESDAKYYREEAESKSRSLNTTKGHITRMKNRIANGVCPCCNRSFEDLHAHMKTKHPKYSETKI